MIKYISQIWKSEQLRKRILFTFFILLVFRIAAHISVPGVNVDVLSSIFQQNQLLGVFSALTGGSMESFSIVLMGLAPYINASIIIQLMTVVIPKLETLSKEGIEGRRTLNKYTRWLTVPLAFLQSYGMIFLLNQSSQNQLLPNIADPFVILPIMVIVVTGTLFLMWLGELITEKGIGNGISLIIFAGIISGVPTVLGRMIDSFNTGDTGRLMDFTLFMVATLVMLVFVVIVTEGQRNIPITYATRAGAGRGEKSILPIRVNQAGMIPIIFAVSLITFPSVLAQFFSASTSEVLKSVATFINTYLNSQNPSYLYILFYFLLIIAFSYFYVSVTFNPENIAENIQKRGGFVPGVRPGRQTSDLLAKTSSYLNLFGGAFVGLIAIIPLFFTKFTSLDASDLIISGAGLIIMVGVILELIRQVDTQLIMHDYDKLY